MNLGDLPPWEYLCLNYTLLADLVLAKASLEVAQTAGIKTAIMKVLTDCSPFLQFDGSFLKSWDIGKKDLIRER